MSAAPEIGVFILNQNPNVIPVRQKRFISGCNVTVYDNRPEKEIKSVGQSGYTDWPHLKKLELHNEIGFYKEDVPMWVCELDFARRINRQTRYFVADQSGTNVFRHIGEEYSFNTGPVQARLARIISRLPLGTDMLAQYKRIKGRWLS